MLLNHRALLFLIYFNQPRPQGFSFKSPGDEVDILITVVSEYRPGAGWRGGGGGIGRDEFWDRETMFSQLAKRSPIVVVDR